LVRAGRCSSQSPPGSVRALACGRRCARSPAHAAIGPDPDDTPAGWRAPARRTVTRERRPASTTRWRADHRATGEDRRVSLAQRRSDTPVESPFGTAPINHMEKGMLAARTSVRPDREALRPLRRVLLVSTVLLGSACVDQELTAPTVE